MAAPRRFVLDTNCFIAASRERTAAAALAAFVAAAAPRLYLSAVVAAELRAGTRTAAATRRLEDDVLGPYRRRGRVLTPSTPAWAAVGETLAELGRRDGLDLARVPRSFAFDILIAHSCREIGATLVSANTADMRRIAQVLPFDFVAPYPRLD